MFLQVSISEVVVVSPPILTSGETDFFLCTAVHEKQMSAWWPPVRIMTPTKGADSDTSVRSPFLFLTVSREGERRALAGDTGWVTGAAEAAPSTDMWNITAVLPLQRTFGNLSALHEINLAA